MKYILLMYHREDAFPGDDLPEAMAESRATCHALHARGHYVDASPLQGVSTATSVSMKNGKRIIMDGPFAETKEQLGGYVLVDVDRQDEALAIAAQFPAARRGTVEVRPLFER